MYRPKKAKTEFNMSGANTFIQRLLPKDKRFFPLFDEFGTTVREASGLYYQLLKTTDLAQRKGIVDQIAVHESQGDKLIHKIITELTATFITPFDREDIHRLASTLDAILDDLLAASRRIVMYRIESIPSHLVELGRCVGENGKLAAECLHILKNIKSPRDFAERIRAIQANKSEADDTFLDGMAGLYNNGGNDSMDVLKLREIYLASDDAMRNFQELSFALEAILIKTT